VEFLEAELRRRPWMEPVALWWAADATPGLLVFRMFVRTVQLDTFFRWVAILNEGVGAFSAPGSWPLSISYDHALSDSGPCFQIRYLYADAEHLAYFQYILKEALLAIPL
jgi:hypothetical protein